MSASSWAAAGPSRPTAASFAAVPKAALAKKKRGRFSDGNSKSKNSDLTNSIPSIVNPPSPELVPRHSSSASSWGIEDLSDSDGDYDWPTSSAALSSAATTNATLDASPDLDRDELARFARPAKRVHLETPDDRHTYGKLAGLQIDPTFMSSSSTPNQHYFFGRPHNARSNSGIAGAFGLGPSVTAAFEANTDGGMTSSPRVPPSSPTKSEAISALFQSSASTFYQQAVAPAPPTSPSMTSRGIAPPSSPLPPPPPQQQQQQSFNRLTLPSTRSSFADLKDSDMRLRRGVPSSYEVEPDRIVVTSLDDTSSSESGDGSIAETGEQQTADADTLPETKDSSSDFVINNELIEKLEAHSRAVLTGTSDRDNNAASTSSRSGKSAGSSRSRRSGRRSAGGSAIPGLGPLLSSRHRSTQSSPASSGYASPINAEDVRGALILWKDPEEVLKATATTYTNSITTTSSPLKQNENATVPESDVVTSGFMTQPPVSFQSGGSNHFSSIPGMAALTSSSSSSSSSLPSLPVESPLYAQQSCLSSSYFPEPSPLEMRYGFEALQPGSQASFGSAAYRSHQPSSQGFGCTYEAPTSMEQVQLSIASLQPHFAPPPSQQQQQQLHQLQQQQLPQHQDYNYGLSCQATNSISSASGSGSGSDSAAGSAFQSYIAPPSHHHMQQHHSQHHHGGNSVGAQPIDLSARFGPAEEMDLDS